MNILVTGSSHGLGKAIMDELRLQGHKVIPYDLDTGLDVADPVNVLSVTQRLDVLINCAGVNSNQWFEEVTLDEFRRVMETNAWSFAAMTQTYFDNLLMSEHPTVINIVSNAAHMPMTSSLCYNASKAAGLMITRQMAHELTPKHGFTVFSISPNKLAGTEMSKAIEDNVCKVRGWTPEFAAEYQKKALMHGQETKPEAIATFIANILASDNYRYMSGTDIPFGK